MRLLILLCTLWLAMAKANDDYKVVCYFGSWAIYRTGNGNFQISDIDPTLCTHMIYTFVGITANGEVRILDEWAEIGLAGFKKFNALREVSPDTKTLVAIGGWNEGSTTYSAVMADDSLRANFVKSVVDFTLKYEFDGFDIDWEYPAQRGGSKADIANYVLLVQELHTAFDKHDLILSAAVAAAESSASLSYDIAQISKYLDFINIMTYDFHTAGESTAGHNAPLYAAARETTEAERGLNVNATVHYWLSKGASAKKLVLGTGLYGRSFTLTDSSRTVPGSPSRGAGAAGPYTWESGMLGYNEICEFQAAGWTTAWDEEQHVPYAYQGNQWVSFDNVQSISEKAEFVKAMGLGGAMIWSIETDDFRGTCGEQYPLLKTLNRVLRGGGSSDSSSASESSTTAKTTTEQSASDLVPESPAVTEASEDTENGNDSTADNETSNNAEQDVNTLCSNSDSKYVRNPENCAQFWLCQKISDGEYKASIFTCSNGLYFDTVYNVCNYDHLVEC